MKSLENCLFKKKGSLTFPDLFNTKLELQEDVRNNNALGLA